MKGAALLVWVDGGGMACPVVSETMAEVDAIADKVRRERVIGKGNKSLDVAEAIVVRINGGDAAIMRRIACRSEKRREAIMAEQAAAKAAKEAGKK